MIDLIRKVYGLFDERERWQLTLLAVALVIRAGVETVGVASIAPFMSVVEGKRVVRTKH